MEFKRSVIIAVLLLLLFTFPACAELMKCDDDIIAFFQTCAEDELESFTMKTSSDMYERLTKNDWQVMEQLQARGGIMNTVINGNLSKYGEFDFAATEYIPKPYSYAENETEFISAVRSYAQSGMPGFTVVIMGKLFGSVETDEERLKILTALSPLKSFSIHTVENGSCVICSFSEAEFSEEPRMLCSAEENFMDAFKGMAGTGMNEYSVVCGKLMYEKVKENDFALLNSLEASAGMVSRDLSYNDDLRILYYSNVVMEAEPLQLNAVQEAAEYVRDRAFNGTSVIPLFCSDDLYRELTEDEDAEVPLLEDIMQNAGILHAARTMNDDKHLITINVIEYYPGLRIARAYATGDTSNLNAREVEAYEICEELGQLCIADTELQTLINVHDAVCARTEYSKDNSDIEKDTCVGALLNRLADCGGYSDAFYAIASIAGLEVRYQSGSAGTGDDPWHMWDLIRIDGTWRAVDTTWDDEGSNACYIWFNFGTDRLESRHRWNYETTVEIAETTSTEERPDLEFLIKDEDELSSAVNSALAAHEKEFILFFTDDSAQLNEKVLSVIKRSGYRVTMNYYWDDVMKYYRVSEIEY